MRQTSESFMNEMLKDNQKTGLTNEDIMKQNADRIAKIIDDNMEKALAKFNEQVAKVNPPAEVETPEEDEGMKKEGELEDGKQNNDESGSDS